VQFVLLLLAFVYVFLQVIAVQQWVLQALLESFLLVLFLPLLLAFVGVAVQEFAVV
jgi:hypothetical protein